MNGYLIIGLCTFVLVAYIMADNAMYKRRWRKCTRCSCWFSDCGDILAQLPVGLPTSRIDGPGVCSDCVKDLEFNRE